MDWYGCNKSIIQVKSKSKEPSPQRTQRPQRRVFERAVMELRGYEEWFNAVLADKDKDDE